MFKVLQNWIHKVAALKVAVHQNEIRSLAMPDKLFEAVKADIAEYESKVEAAFNKLFAGVPAIDLDLDLDPATESAPEPPATPPVDTGTPGVEVTSSEPVAPTAPAAMGAEMTGEPTPVTPSETAPNGPAQ